MPSFTTEESRSLDAWLNVRLLGGFPDIRVPALSTSYEGMGAVLEAMRERHFGVDLTHQPNSDTWAAFFGQYTGDGGAHGSWGDGSLPLAVALAAKAALESETGSSS